MGLEDEHTCLGDPTGIAAFPKRAAMGTVAGSCRGAGSGSSSSASNWAAVAFTAPFLLDPASGGGA